MAIIRFEKINMTPAFAFAVEAHLELIRAQSSQPAQGVNWDDHAVCADIAMLEDRKIVGIITWSAEDWMERMCIKIGYVHPNFRGRGLYRAMWAELVKWAQESKFKTIWGSTMLANRPMRAVAKKLGRTEDSVNLTFSVPSSTEPPAPPRPAASEGFP